MPREIKISVNPEQTEKLISALSHSDNVLSVQLYKDASIKPNADVLSVTVSNKGLFSVLSLIEHQIGDKPQSFTLSSPAAIYSQSSQDKVNADIVESVWEETEYLLQQTSRISFNFIILMILSGSIAAVGLSTGVLHLVLAAMLVIPGFQPIVNIPLGIVLKNKRLVKLGMKTTFYGYLIFMLSSILTFHVLRWSGQTSISAFMAMPMVQFWASFNLSAVIISMAAASAGITIIPTHRSVLTAGVMVALALVPGAAISGISLASGQWEYAWRGIAHWALDFANIIVFGVIIFALKKALIHKREAWY